MTEEKNSPMNSELNCCFSFPQINLESLSHFAMNRIFCT